MRTRSSKGSLSALGVTLVALLALGAFLGSASASAATQHWYGYAGGTKLAEKTPTEVEAEDLYPTSIKLNYAGIELEIRCNSMSAGGAIENPAGGGGGTLSGAAITLGECTVQKPVTCTVDSTLVTNKLKGTATKYEGSPAIKYESEIESILITFNLGGSSCPSILKGSKTLTGSFIASHIGSGGHYQVTSASSTGVKWGGQTVALRADYQLNSKAGKAVALATDSPAGEHWYLGGTPASGAKTKLAEGSSVNYSSVEGSTSFSVSATIGGVKTKLQCGGSAEGSVENPVGGAAGTATGSTTLVGCAFSEPAACSVANPVAFAPLSGSTTEAGGPAVKFSPAEGTTFATFTVSGASCPVALKGSKSLTGKSLTGVPDLFGIYAFSGNELKYAGQAATVSAQTTLETSTGERLGILP